MKIGVFDSGIGGLIISHALSDRLPEYDYMYFGDTARAPYGNRSQETIYEYSRQAVAFLFQQDCSLVIIACNTASAEALRRLQQEWLPSHFPDRNILGVLIPAAESAVSKTHGHIGVLATASTVESKAFEREIHKLRPEMRITQQAAPLLVPLIENDGQRFASPIIEAYVAPLRDTGIDTLVLGCTHYPLLKNEIQAALPEVTLICQDETIPASLANYLERHPERQATLSQNGGRRFCVTDLTRSVQQAARMLYGQDVQFEVLTLE
jgi:glutamate racemase